MSPRGWSPALGASTGELRDSRRFADAFWREFDDPRIEVHELIDAGDRVLASTTLRGHGKQSGADTSSGVCQVWTVRDGSAVRGQGFPSREEALEAVGLPE